MMKKKEFNNIVFEFLYFALTIFFNLIIRKLIVSMIGIELVGLNNILNQVINFISLFEFGLSNIIMSYLYKPLKEHDEKRISQVMTVFKKLYFKFSVIILFFGLCVIPFLKYFINDYNLSINYYVIYILLLFQIGITNYLSYKTFLIRADQKAYLYLRLMCIIKFLSLVIEPLLFIFTKNYYLFLIFNIGDNIFSYFVVSKYIDKKYPYLKNKVEGQKSDLVNIKKEIKNTAVCKISVSLYNSLDAVILGLFSTVEVLGLYSNYYVLLNSLNSIVYKFFYSFQSKIGNALVGQTEEESYVLLYKMNYISYVLGISASIIFYLFVDFIIKIWLGSKYLLPNQVVIAFSIQLFIMIYRTSLWQYTTVKGWFRINKISDSIGVVINLILSIILYLKFNLIGIIIGTIISEIIKYFIELYLIIKSINIKYKI